MKNEAQDFLARVEQLIKIRRDMEDLVRPFLKKPEPPKPKLRLVK